MHTCTCNNSLKPALVTTIIVFKQFYFNRFNHCCLDLLIFGHKLKKLWVMLAQLYVDKLMENGIKNLIRIFFIIFQILLFCTFCNKFLTTISLPSMQALCSGVSPFSFT